MKKRLSFTLFFLVLFLFNLNPGLSSSNQMLSSKASINFYSDLLNMPTWMIDRINDNKTLEIYDDQDTSERYTVFDAKWDNRGNQTVVIVDMNGDIVGGYEDGSGDNQMLNSTTLMMQTDSNITFWNLFTNKTEIFPVPESLGQHHDWEYNPLTKTFLILGREINGTVDILNETYPIMHDTITEIDKQGNILWHWRTYENIPFDQDFYALTNFTGRGRADWTHGNTVFWDFENDEIYLNCRNIHSFFKIDKTTGDILWQCGAYNSDFTHIDKYGEEKISFFYGQHDVNMLGENHFMIFDNDWENVTNRLNQRSRYVEFIINENTNIATEIWSWVAPDAAHFGDHWGGASRLPDGNTLGAIGGTLGDPTYITEVNSKGEIVWELSFNGTGAYRTEEFYSHPQIVLKNETLVPDEHNNLTVKLGVWNSYRNRIPIEGHAIIKVDEENLLDQSFNFLPHWQETGLELEVSLDGFKNGEHNLTLSIQNDDGITKSKLISFELKGKSASSGVGLVLSVSILTTLVVLRKKR